MTLIQWSQRWSEIWTFLRTMNGPSGPDNHAAGNSYAADLEDTLKAQNDLEAGVR